MKICFYCEKPIKEKDPMFMYAVDMPYMNLWFHKKCYDIIEDTTGEYILSNYDKLNEFIKERDT